LDVRILGPIDLAGGEGPLPGGRQRTILAVLALRAPEAVPVERLIDAAWGASPPRGVENLVQVYVSRLRRLLGGERLERRGNAYALHLEPGGIGKTRLARAAAEALRAPRRRRQRRRAGSCRRPGTLS
jgi:DNA-binding SARP family transcriptional activator